MNLVTCKNVSFAYEGKIVVNNLSFEVLNGDYLCIVGENGSGKSTLMKGLLRLKQPVSGSILTDESLYSNEIGYLPQQSAAQKDFPASVQEVVISGCLSRRGILPFYSASDRKRAEQNMKLLDIYNIRKRCYRDLSGGQQQRTLLARALCATHKVLLLDEPAVGLDPLATQELYNQIEHINKNMGITIIMVSHDINSALKYAKHILHLNNNQLFFGTTEDYIKSNVSSSFLGGAKA